MRKAKVNLEVVFQAFAKRIYQALDNHEAPFCTGAHWKPTTYNGVTI